jgi:hypothetical protein
MNANVFGADDTLQVLNGPFGSTWSDVKVSDDKGLTLWLLKKRSLYLKIHGDCVNISNEKSLWLRLNAELLSNQ